ncbi:hypothetical protein UE98_10380 [Burkholderia cenocepacia]|nr:hypothetical protein UE98_10380 [Burkholderia cenocepacia]
MHEIVEIDLMIICSGQRAQQRRQLVGLEYVLTMVDARHRFTNLRQANDPDANMNQSSDYGPASYFAGNFSKLFFHLTTTL